MIEWVLAFSVRRRWYVLLFTIAAALFGAWALTVLPIDAVPDITNVQVQVNAFAPALSPLEVEKQVTFPIEVALAGTPASKRRGRFRATALPRSPQCSATGPISISPASR